MTKQQTKNDQVKQQQPAADTATAASPEAAKPEAQKTVWLANKTKRPIHIMQTGKDEDGNHLANIRLSTMGAVEVAEDTLKLNGVKQLLGNKSLVVVTAKTAKKLNAAHDAVITMDDDDEDEAEDETED